MAYILTLILILAYALILYWLRYEGVIQSESFISNISLFVGWLVALLIAWIHLCKNRSDTLNLNKQETKKRLEIEAFRELNSAISRFSNAIGSVSVAYWTWPSKLDLHRENPSV
ncbi:unnamed protein product, partial [marine sediment metagenome]